jgi:hypothetical protein
MCPRVADGPQLCDNCVDNVNEGRATAVIALTNEMFSLVRKSDHWNFGVPESGKLFAGLQSGAPATTACFAAKAS